MANERMHLRWLLASTCAVVMATMTTVLCAQEESIDEAFFEKRIRPVLVERCYECHAAKADDIESGLRVDSREALLRGGDRGPAIVLGDPETSLLILAIRHADQINMPPRDKLPPAVVADFTRWVAASAPWPASAETVSSPPSGEPPKPRDAARDKTPSGDDRLWSLEPPLAHRRPVVKDRSWSRSWIDDFVLAQLESVGLTPAPLADRATWLRRVTFDLTGLPPTISELEQFLADGALDAEARCVDRLLASPRYGERWGRHWLDVVRYADSNGMDENLSHAHAYRYRDYIVRSFNADKPFSHLVEEQIAGDLLGDDHPTPAADRVIATGFLVIGPKMLAEDDPVKMQMDIIDEQVDTMGRAFMGMTIGCARCHDHKYDPLSMRDYYSLASIFKSTRTMENFRVVAKWNERSIAEPSLAARHAELTQQLASLPQDSEDAKKLQATLPELPMAMSVGEGEITDLRVHLRGSHLSLGDPVARGIPVALQTDDWQPLDAPRSGRLELARWLTGPHHPLTARVIVNRIWQGHFGFGLVRSPDNLGRLGDRPTHPELLDTLAVWLQQHNWSLKSLHRELVLSATYRMSSIHPQESPTVANATTRAMEIDPENRWLWHMNRRRLEVEALRDSLLALSGDLDLRMEGTLLPTPNRQYVTSTANVNPVVYGGHRRSLYLPVVRSALFELFQAFDFADPSAQAGRRESTTVAPQALFLMNSQFVTEQTRRWAEQLLARRDGDDAERIAIIHRAALSRAPTAAETTRAIEYLSRFETAWPWAQQDPHAAKIRAWESFCRAILSTNEFIYVD